MSNLTSGVGNPRDTMERTPEKRGAVDSDQSVGSLIRELADEGRTLVRKEMELVKVELTETMNEVTSAISSIAVGGGILLAGLIIFLIAISEALTAWLVEVMDPQIAIWLAPLILAVVLGVIGYSMISGARKKLREASFRPEKAEYEANRTKEWAKEKVKNG